MKQICAAGATVRGVDIYQGNMISNFGRILAAGIQFMFFKAFEHQDDPDFVTRFNLAGAHGVIRGAYDFFHPAKDPIAQAKAFLAIVQPHLKKGDMVALDWETTDGEPSAADRDAGLAWLNYVAGVVEPMGVKVGIYGSPYFLQALALDSRFAKFFAWIAHYAVKCPLVPDVFPAWTFHQGSSTGAVPGLVGNIDTDDYNGTMEELKAWLGI